MRRTAAVAAVLLVLAATYLTGTADAARRVVAAATCTQYIALTFDDGPSAGTPAALDLLRRNGVRVTFFVQGDRAQAEPAQLRRMKGDGHEIGNHSYRHPNLTELPIETAAVEIGRTQAAVAAATGQVPSLVRSPYGLADARLLDVYKAYGLTHVMWNDQGLDWEDPPVDTLVQRITDGARPGGIVLLHEERANTRAALPRIISTLRGQGYCFGKVAPTDQYDPDLRSAVRVTPW